MGSLYDEHTAALLETMEKFGFYNGYFDSILRALDQFGRPTEMMLSPAQLDAILGAYKDGEKKKGKK